MCVEWPPPHKEEDPELNGSGTGSSDPHPSLLTPRSILRHQCFNIQHSSLPSASAGFAGAATRTLAALPLADEMALEERTGAGGERLLEGDNDARQLVDVEAEEDFGDATGDETAAVYPKEFEMESEGVCFIEGRRRAATDFLAARIY